MTIEIDQVNKAKSATQPNVKISISFSVTNVSFDNDSINYDTSNLVVINE